MIALRFEGGFRSSQFLLNLTALLSLLSKLVVFFFDNRLLASELLLDLVKINSELFSLLLIALISSCELAISELPFL